MAGKSCFTAYGLLRCIAEARPTTLIGSGTTAGYVLSPIMRDLEPLNTEKFWHFAQSAAAR